MYVENDGTAYLKPYRTNPEGEFEYPTLYNKDQLLSEFPMFTPRVEMVIDDSRKRLRRRDLDRGKS